MRLFLLSLFICLIAAKSLHNQKVTVKRVGTSCEVNSTNAYPSDCNTGTGSKCRPDAENSVEGTCGCDNDYDCFNDVSRPYCLNHQCVQCYQVQHTEDPNADNNWCRSRYPGYEARPDDPNHPLSNERVAPQGYFREVCLRESDDPQVTPGSCQRCNQAPTRVPDYPFPSKASREGASGTYFCKGVYANLPICMDKAYFTDCGAASFFNESRRGSCSGCFHNNALCARALPNTPVCHNDACVACSSNSVCNDGAGGANCEADGSCKNCENNKSCRETDGGEAPNQWICKESICQGCINNADCQTDADYGNNCGADGTCFKCATDSDCANNDGGEVKGQTLCNVENGICESACVTNEDCADGAANCMTSGRCMSCRANADCGEADAGEKPGQTDCDLISGVCTDPYNCQEAAPGGNEGCKAYGGGNCQIDGHCVKCESNADCGDKDGGVVPGQHYCDTHTGVCDRCTKNAHCAGNALNKFNCGEDGFCHSCVVDGCGDIDGPPEGPTNGQLHCDEETHQCVDTCTLDEHCTEDCLPVCLLRRGCCVECTQDSHCPLTAWRNEQSQYNMCSNTTFTCVAGCAGDVDCAAPTPACSSGGSCIGCTNDAHCLGHVNGTACSSSGSCVTCNTDSHCVGNPSGNVCLPDAQQCVSCFSDLHCPLATLPACDQKLNKCVACVNDEHCVTAANPDDHFHCHAGACVEAADHDSMDAGTIAALVIGCIALVTACVGIVLIMQKLRSHDSDQHLLS